MKYRQCPSCGAVSDSGPKEQCDACGIIYVKWLKKKLATKDPDPAPVRKVLPDLETSQNWTAPWRFVEERVNVFEFGARLVVLGVMVFWGWALIDTDPRQTTGLFPELSFRDPVISSFVLVFHEAGHVIFSIFGRFMAVAGRYQ